MTAPLYDLVLQGGHVIDPAFGISAVLDVGVREGKIAAVGAGLAGGARVVDVSGKYVCPGLIDLHGHWYERQQFWY